MLNGLNVVRVLVLLLVVVSFTLVTLLVLRLLNQFCFVSKGKELAPETKYSAVIAIAGYAINNAIYMSVVLFYCFRPKDRLPELLLYSTLLITVLIVVAKYTLFTVRLMGSFKGTVYKLTDCEISSLFIGLSFTILCGVISACLWRRGQDNDSPMRMTSALFIVLGAVSHITVSVYFMGLFVNRLRKLLTESTSLRTRCDKGHHIDTTVAVKHLFKSLQNLSETNTNDKTEESTVVTEMKKMEMDTVLEIPDESPVPNQKVDKRPVLANDDTVSVSISSGTSTNVTDLSVSSVQKSVVSLKEDSTKTLEEQAVMKVILDSEIIDRTYLVVMVRYTLLKIIEVVSSLIFMAVGVFALVTSLNYRKYMYISELEIVIIFGSIVSIINSLCLFFTFYSFGFSIFQYQLICGKAESEMMHCFEKNLKMDFFEQVLRDAQKALRDKETYDRARAMSATAEDIANDSHHNLAEHIKNDSDTDNKEPHRVKKVVSFRSMSHKTSGISLALI